MADYTLAKTGADIDAIHTKVDGIEESADVTDATNVAAAGAVMDTGNETIAGIKTFSSSPVVPAPTTDLQAATKKYVDDNAGGSATWGGITGTLSSQTDLQSALDAKQATIVNSDSITEGSTNLFLTTTERSNISTNNSKISYTDAAIVATAVQPGDAITDLDGTANRVLYVNATGDVTELALGASGTVLQSNGATSAPTFEAGSGSGDMTIATYDAANVSEQLVGLTATQTLTNKTLTSPSISTPTGIVKGDVGLGNVDNTSDATKDAASATLTNKTINAASNQVEITTQIHTSGDTLTADECYGKVHYVAVGGTLTLPAIADGMHLTVITIGATAVSVDCNASDKIWLDGMALDDGDKITNLSTAGDIAVLTYYSADGWHASTNGWTDGGA